ncbi:MAG: hypothetical protein J6038_05025 [Bacilli bacterium]|nr:hypothetical protein [Bacilli bacterium]
MVLKLVPDKRIGRVIYFTEGQVDEPVLLKGIFHDVLHYEAGSGGPPFVFRKPGDPYSQVYVAPMPSSAIKHIPGDEEFLDRVYGTLRQYGLEKDEAAVYYLYDRDPQSNKAEAVKEKIRLLKNPLDNGIELPGALLLSYPCLQAFYCQANDIEISFSKSKEAKKFANKNNLKSLDESKLCAAGSNMLSTLELLRKKAFSIDELSDYSRMNEEVFDAEEKNREKTDGCYLTLSLLAISLLDLGILALG